METALKYFVMPYDTGIEKNKMEVLAFSISQLVLKQK